jgi:hypothetical protein
MDNKKLAKEIISSILDAGLKDSTWKDNNPHAYTDLLDYRLDMEVDVEKVLNQETKK